MKFQKYCLFALMFLSFVFAGSTFQTITFQGRLINTVGAPVNGQKYMQFKFFSTDAPGGTLLYTYPSSSGTRVICNDGNYAVEIPFSTESDIWNLVVNNEVYVELYIGDSSALSSSDILLPRIHMTANGFALGAWQIAGNQLYVDHTNSKVGIGTTTPVEKLDVNGNAIVRGTVSANGVIIVSGTAPEIRTNATNKYLLLSGGNNGYSAGAAITLRGSSGSTNPYGIEMFTGGTEAVRILTNGNFGIGTTSPTDKLSVIGNIKATGNITATGKVYNACWNDVAEFRKMAPGQKKIPGKVYVGTEKGLTLATKRCQAGTIGVCSDTYGQVLGGTEKDLDKAPIGIAGWVLAYVDKKYPIGTPLVSDKNGNLTKASYFEKLNHPERIVAIVEQGPDTIGKVNVNGRTWVKIK